MSSYSDQAGGGGQGTAACLIICAFTCVKMVANCPATISRTTQACRLLPWRSCMHPYTTRCVHAECVGGGWSMCLVQVVALKRQRRQAPRNRLVPFAWPFQIARDLGQQQTAYAQAAGRLCTPLLCFQEVCV